MMKEIVECVPKFSEGRNRDIIDAIGNSVRKVSGVKLLRVEPDKDYNRTVVTFVGAPAAVVKAAFQAMKTQAEPKEATPPSPVEAEAAIGDDSR